MGDEWHAAGVVQNASAWFLSESRFVDLVGGLGSERTN